MPKVHVANTHASVKKPAPETNAILTWNQLAHIQIHKRDEIMTDMRSDAGKDWHLREPGIVDLV